MSNLRQIGLSTLLYAEDSANWTFRSHTNGYYTQLSFDSRESPHSYFGNLQVLVCPGTKDASDDYYVYEKLGVFFAVNNFTGTSYRWIGTRGTYHNPLSNTFFRRWVHYVFPQTSDDPKVMPCTRLNALGRMLHCPETGKGGYVHPASEQPIAFDGYALQSQWRGWNDKCWWTNNHTDSTGTSAGVNVLFFDGHGRWAAMWEGGPRTLHPGVDPFSGGAWVYW